MWKIILNNRILSGIESNINIQVRDGRALLYVSCFKGHENIAKYLLKNMQ